MTVPKTGVLPLHYSPIKNGAADEAYDPRDLHIISVMFLRRTELQQHNFDSIR